MKPINQHELNKGYFNFIAYFVALILLVVVCVACFFSANRHELKLLAEEVRRYDQLAYQREEVAARFDQMLFKLRAFSQYVNADAQVLSNQALLINGVQSENNRVRGLLEENAGDGAAPGSELYQKMTRHVVVLAGLKDSLSQTRFSSESLRQQLDACSKATRKAVNNLNRF
ncbi:hypothetical protein EGT74_25710 [Chitinophaga lutea]|uniref:Uncharacterized protein n=1 Tax=Chitinophaga lutea TaxID=2488634 RepID=A0A3N4PAV7_9BACT|nr:hypothetical protein [Chitinophaga lutea]RPE05763.1 hypothetical protein EGT74_25710 [Chitinophaga lutea]